MPYGGDGIDRSEAENIADRVARKAVDDERYERERAINIAETRLDDRIASLKAEIARLENRIEVLENRFIGN